MSILSVLVKKINKINLIMKLNLLYIALLLFTLSSCNKSNTEQTIQNKTQNDSIKKDTLVYIIKDSVKKVILNIDTFNVKKNKSKTTSKKNNTDLNSIGLTRFIDLPSDNSFNGEPIKQQIEISQKVLTSQADTLQKLALYNYTSYKSMYPKAIADNFETRTSNEIIMYPKKIIFSFLVFEDNKSLKPYHTQNITVIRNSNGELNIE